MPWLIDGGTFILIDVLGHGSLSLSWFIDAMIILVSVGGRDHLD